MGQLRTQGLQQQQAQLGLQQQQLQLQSNQAMMKAFANGGGDWAKTQPLLDSDPDILPTDRMAVEQHRLQLQKDAAGLTKDKQAIFSTDVDRYRGFLSGVNNQDDLDQANLQAEKAGIGSQVPRMTTFSDPAHVQAFSNSLALHSQLTEEALKGAQTGEASAKGAEAQAGATAQTRAQAIQQLSSIVDPKTGIPAPNAIAALQKKYPDVFPPTFNPQDKSSVAQMIQSAVPVAEQGKAKIDQIRANLLSQAQNAVQNGVNPIDSILPASLDSGANSSYKAAYSAAMSQPPDENGRRPAADSIMAAAAAHAATIQLAGNPKIIAGHAAQAGADAWATVSADVQKQVQAEIQKARMAPGALSSIIDPATRNQALTQWNQADKEYQIKAGDAARLLSMVQAARNDNQNAASLLNIAEVREIVSRVNTQELQAAGGGVSALRNIQNWLSAKTQGKPSAATLNDVDQVGKLMLGAARVTRNGIINHLNTGLGAKIPLETGAAAAPSGAPVYLRQVKNAAGHVIGQTADGKWHDVETGAVIQ
jgi:hypothetical protein